jgi:adenylate cyclase
VSRLRRPAASAGLALEALASCFQGLIPATLFTCARDGTPNAAFLSHVDYVDPRHVALSFQFFNKSRRNISENPHALVRLIDPDTSQGWRLRLRYVRSESSGPVFDRMALRIEAIASYSGLKGIFKLLAADIYEVLAVEPVEDERPRAAAGAGRRPASADPVFTMKALQDLSDRIHRADSIERLLDSILEGLEESFGFTHAMILVPASEEGVLVTIASRGYPENGVGAEARVGEGIIGMVAEAKKPIRISGLLQQMLYAYAVRRQATQAGLAPANRRIPLPGLPNPESQLGVPLLVRGELVGVLCIESTMPYRFHEETARSSSCSAATWRSRFRTSSSRNARRRPSMPRPRSRLMPAVRRLPAACRAGGRSPTTRATIASSSTAST